MMNIQHWNDEGQYTVQTVGGDMINSRPSLWTVCKKDVCIICGRIPLESVKVSLKSTADEGEK